MVEELVLKNRSTKELISGSCGGIACTVSGQPLDTIKVNLQIFPDKYNGMIDCAKKIYGRDGILGFYRGCLAATSCSVMENAVAFLCYNRFMRFSENILDGFNVSNQSPWYHVSSKLFAGSTSGFCASFVITPSELFKCRLQTSGGMQPNKKITVRTILSEVLAEKGPLGFFSGIQATITREMVGYSLIFGGYEVSRSYLSSYTTGNLTNLLSGGIGGISYWLVLYPVDVIKSRIQVSSLNEGVKQTFLRIYHKEGFKTFYSGIVPTLIRAFVANACLFYSYEQSICILNKIWRD